MAPDNPEHRCLQILQHDLMPVRAHLPAPVMGTAAIKKPILLLRYRPEQIHGLPTVTAHHLLFKLIPPRRTAPALRAFSVVNPRLLCLHLLHPVKISPGDQRLMGIPDHIPGRILRAGTAPKQLPAGLPMDRIPRIILIRQQPLHHDPGPFHTPLMPRHRKPL